MAEARKREKRAAYERMDFTSPYGTDGNGGKTLAESLGIEVAADAPGGHRLPMASGGDWKRGKSRRWQFVNAAEYDGYGDVDQ